MFSDFILMFFSYSLQDNLQCSILFYIEMTEKNCFLFLKAMMSLGVCYKLLIRCQYMSAFDLF